ncbi:MAG TPA: hypothetical protein VIX17_30390, partial [Pyrinomonadaceae bacterium]
PLVVPRRCKCSGFVQERQRASRFLPAAQLKFIDPTLDDCYHLAIAHHLRRFAVSSYLVWFAAFVPLHDLYSGIHCALLDLSMTVSKESATGSKRLNRVANIAALLPGK